MTQPSSPDEPAGGTLAFLARFLRNPRGIGAIAPSGPALAARMAAGLGEGQRVLELGGGTGRITRAILAAGVRPQDLTVIERDPLFVELLRRQFPVARVLRHSAFELAGLAAQGPFDAIISGLPLVNFTPREHAALLAGAFEVLAPDGFLRQFTYRPRCPLAPDVLAEAGAQSRYEGMVLANMPPAFIYRIEPAAPGRNGAPGQNADTTPPR